MALGSVHRHHGDLCQDASRLPGRVGRRAYLGRVRRVKETHEMSLIAHCPRAKSDMTPCVRRDKYAADDDRYCVGCGLGANEVADELRDIARGAVDLLAEARDYVSATAPTAPTRDLLLRIDAILRDAGGQ